MTYTLAGEPFSAWVKEEIANRNEELAKKQNLLIDMDPEIAKAFHNSVNISSRSNRHLSDSLVQILLTLMLFSGKWKQCSPPQGWLKASQNASRDEKPAGSRGTVPGH